MADRPPRKPVTERDLARPLHCLCFNLRRTTRALTQIYDAALAPSGLTVSQFSVLSVIGLAAPIAMRKLAAWLGMDRTTLTRAIAPLVRDGLVREVEARDRRERRLSLTAEGRQRLKDAEPFWRQVQSEAAAALGTARCAALLGELGELRQALGAE